MDIVVNVKRLSSTAKIPTHGSTEAAGWDLYADIEGTEELTIAPGETVKISSGIAMAIPTGYWGGIYARSGMATKLGLAPANKVGVIDSDYRGPVIVALHNHSNTPAVVKHGERIAQLIIERVLPITFHEVEGLNDTERGTGGFGSTGVN